MSAPGVAANSASPRWHSRRGFLLATLGSAVGLGNVWRFSYVVGENGGGAFLLVYVATVLAVGIPLLLAEFALGRSTRRESVQAIQTVAAGSAWRHAGWVSVGVASLILAYYAVIAGWVVKYLALFLLGAFGELSQAGFSTAFDAYVAKPLEPLAWQAGVLIITAAVIARGVNRGIERLSTILMPLLAALLIALAAHSALLPGFSRGLAFLFQPDWSALRNPQVYLAAVGQAFFSLGVAMGVLVTYGSYLSPGVALPRASLLIALGDTLFALTAGLMIFPAVFSFGLDPAQGPGLAFVVLPEVFSQMRGGRIVGATFFLLLSIAALTSMVSLLEVPVAYLTQRLRISRAAASGSATALIFCLGAPASLGFGVWSEVASDTGRGLLSLMDFVAVNLLLPLNGLLLAVLVGWVWSRREAIGASDLPTSALGTAWHFSVRYLLPVLLIAVLVSSIGAW